MFDMLYRIAFESLVATELYVRSDKKPHIKKQIRVYH